MVRMTDLLNKAKKQKGIRSPLPKEEKPPVKEIHEPAEVIEKLSRETERPRPTIKSTIHKPPVQPDSDEQDIKLYFEAIEKARTIFNTYKDSGEINKDEIVNITSSIANKIIAGSREFLRLFHEIDSQEDYIYHNAVNVCTLSVIIGIVYNYDSAILSDLAVIGFLHDLDLINSKDIINKSEKLSKDEEKTIKKHPLNAATLVDSAFKFGKEKVEAILQHHERRDGEGYPAGLADQDIHDLAAIVGLADTYEAMTHSRPYKNRMRPHEALITIIDTGKELFSNEVIKALVSCIGLYPVGSWVELNTGELCKVLQNSFDSPLRPTISICKDKEGNRLREIRTIDLGKFPSLYIKKIIEEMEA